MSPREITKCKECGTPIAQRLDSRRFRMIKNHKGRVRRSQDPVLADNPEYDPDAFVNGVWSRRHPSVANGLLCWV